MLPGRMFLRWFTVRLMHLAYLDIQKAPSCAGGLNHWLLCILASSCLVSLLPYVHGGGPVAVILPANPETGQG